MTAPTPLTQFSTLIGNVDATHFDIWKDDFLKAFGTDANEIKAIISHVENEKLTTSLNGDAKTIFEELKNMQKKYVHVSLFASLSYVYISQMIQEMNAKLNIIKEDNAQALVALNKELATAQKSGADFAALTAEIAALKLQKDNYDKLQQLLTSKANGLKEFISKFNEQTATVAVVPPAPAPTPAPTSAPPGVGGSKRKKGGFIRDGTRAELAGAPYPKAS